MIKKSKSNEDKMDFKKIMSELNEEIREKDAEQDIINCVPILLAVSPMNSNLFIAAKVWLGTIYREYIVFR